METENTKLIVDRDGDRLDLYIAMNDNSISRSVVRRMIDQGIVYVNNNIEYRPHYKVKVGDVIEYKKINAKNEVDYIVPVDIPLNIIFEDDDLLVLNKPAGMVTHPATGHESDTLMNGVLFYYNQLSNVGDKRRSGLIHRLDKDTSGTILVGKTNLGLWHYSKLFAEKKVEKTYLVVVLGDISNKFVEGAELTVKTFHARNSLNRKKFSSQKSAFGKLAETSFRLCNVIRIDGAVYSLIKASPHTGRTHQIRVHLSEMGYPVLGDPIYGPNSYSRLMLHSWKLKLKMIKGGEKTFVSEIPLEFKTFITNESKL
jgi:23S rRNA pseudouridine1911/1915/1917 synthase